MTATIDALVAELRESAHRSHYYSSSTLPLEEFLEWRAADALARCQEWSQKQAEDIITLGQEVGRFEAAKEREKLRAFELARELVEIRAAKDRAEAEREEAEREKKVMAEHCDYVAKNTPDWAARLAEALAAKELAEADRDSWLNYTQPAVLRRAEHAEAKLNRVWEALGRPPADQDMGELVAKAIAERAND